MFGVWNLLTFGKTGPGGLTFFQPRFGPYGYQRPPQEFLTPSYATRPLQAGVHPFFVPLNGAVVYDHRVGYGPLRDVPLLFLVGPDISDETVAAVKRRVNEGAVAVVWGPLAKREALAEWESGVRVVPAGEGKYVVTDDFDLPEVMQQVWHLIGQPDRIRYRLGDHEVSLWDAGGNRVRVEVDGAPAGP